MIKEKLQDSEYEFPYHYLPEYSDNFSMYKIWSWGLNYISAIEFILNKISEIDFKSVCDIGTGDGRLVKELVKRFSDKAIFGIDYSQKAIALAKVLNPNVNFICQDILAQNVKIKVDIVTLVEVFEHIPLDKCQSFVDTIHAILNENGKLILTVPHINKKLQEKHYQHFNYAKLYEYFGSKYEFEEIIYFEKNVRNLGLILINKLLHNSLFILNQTELKNYLYNLYKKYFFYSSETNCGRIYVKMRKK